MIQVYADEALVYDSRLEDYKLLGIPYTTGLNKGGTASIVMPPEHPAYNSFTSFRTVVTIYRDDKLLFRGRALYPSDDFYNRRTITCEGERCFLRDAVMRPYLFQEAPADIFTKVIEEYNSQVEEVKQFVIGEVTVTDPNDYIRLESSTAEQISGVIDKLVERCGGYVEFSTNEEGRRAINWLAELPYRSSQVIEFGENLLDFTRSDANTDLATVIFPYGAKDDTGTQITIESVNDGLDFIKDDEAIALRGWIAKSVYWDDVTEPANLLTKAQKYLASSKNMITTLELSAVDLSLMDKSIESFQNGDMIRVRSKPHKVDVDFQLTDRTGDYLAPDTGTITMGRQTLTLTGSDVAGDKQTIGELHRVENSIRSDYAVDIAQVQETLMSLISQTSESIRLEVSETYATNGAVEESISTKLTQLSESITIEFERLETQINGNRDEFSEIYKYIRFVDGNIILGESGNELTLKIENDRISFLDEGAEVAYFSNKKLVVTDGNFLNSLQIGSFAWIPRENGNLSLVKVGG